ncbi:MAG: tetratricopeptide repeat protein [Armatimonadota bacterium]|jgi:tetratricopeptide (TPR) repeat protein
MVWSHYIAGNTCESRSDYATALVHYSAIIDGKYTEVDNFANRDITLYSLRRSANCYARLGQPDKERQMWEAIIQRYPDNPIAKIAEAELAKRVGGK